MSDAKLTAEESCRQALKTIADAFRYVQEETVLRDCGQHGVCRTPPGCARHWEERNRELLRENEVLRSNSDHLSSENASLVRQVESMAMRIESLAEELAKPEDVRLREVLDAMGASYATTDPALWSARPRFGVAGGPVEIVLTDEGDMRAFSVGAAVRRGGPAEALSALWSAQGEGHLSVRGEGARIKRTELGRYDQVAWGYLRVRGLVESFQDDQGDGVRLTEAGKRAAWDGCQERERLLERCKGAAKTRAERDAPCD